MNPDRLALALAAVLAAGTAGTVVSGVLYVDTFSATVDSGDELAAVPYRYTIG